MKNQALFSSKDKSKLLKCRLLTFLFSALRVKSLCCQHGGSLDPYVPFKCTMNTLIRLGSD